MTPQVYLVTRRIRKSIQKITHRTPFFDFQLALFLILLTVYCLERVLSLSIIASDLTCIDKRTVFLGETSLDSGIYHALTIIALLTLGLVLLEFALQITTNSFSRARRYWVLPTINFLATLGLLAIIATPWAYYNIGHPLSDRIYQVRGMIAPSVHFERPDFAADYSIDPEIWRCDNGPCKGHPRDTVSIYHHRYLDFSYRFVLISECMSPEFNLATAQAIDAQTKTWDGERRVTARAFFDGEGRFVGPNDKWFRTPLMWSQLTGEESQTSSLSFDHLMVQLSNWTLNETPVPTLPEWVDWTILERTIKSGNTVTIHAAGDLLLGIRTNDGTEFVGTQSADGDLDQALEDCGDACKSIEITR